MFFFSLLFDILNIMTLQFKFKVWLMEHINFNFFNNFDHVVSDYD